MKGSDIGTIGKVFLVVVLTLLSGFGDSQGFVHSARIWEDDRLVWSEVFKSAIGYGLGIAMYWFAIRYLKQFGVVSPEIQTLGWFVVTIVGVAVLSGEFLRWPVSEQVVAGSVFVGICWLVFCAGS